MSRGREDIIFPNQLESKVIYMIGNNKFSKQLGFTLIEVMISSLVFSIIMITVSSLFIQILNNQRRAFAMQKIQENSLFIMELMAREIRVSKIENQNSPDCTLTSLSITHPVNGPVTYSLIDN